MNGLAEMLLKHNCQYDVDVSGFDLTVPKLILESVSAFNKRFTDAGDVLSNMLDAFFMAVSSSPVIAGKTLLARHGGVSSGITCTSLIDSQCMQMIFYLAAARMYGYDLMPTEYYDVAWTYSTGDDTVLSSSDPLITGQVVADFVTEMLKMDFTDTSKAATVAAKSIVDISYASRKFTPVAGHVNLFTGALKVESISSALCWSESSDPTIITEVVKNALNEVALHSCSDYERLCGLIHTSGFQINPIPHCQFMADLASQILTAASKHDIKATETTFVIADSELPRTVAKQIDLSKFKKDRISREMETVLSIKTEVHRFQKVIEEKPLLSVLVKTAEFQAVLDSQVSDDRTWVEGAHVPQIYSNLMWVDAAKYLAGDEVSWVTTLAGRKIDGGANRKVRHAERWTRVTISLASMRLFGDVGAGKKLDLYPLQPDLPAMQDEPLANEILMEVYTVLAESRSWGEFLGDARVAILGNSSLHERTTDRWNVIYRSSLGEKGAIYMYHPRRIGELRMWIDIYHHYRLDDGNPFTWLRMAGATNVPDLWLGQQHNVETHNLHHDVSKYLDLGRLLRQASFNAEGFRRLQESIGEFKYNAYCGDVPPKYKVDPPAYSAQVATKEAAQPPITEQTSAPSATGGSVAPVGVGMDDMESAAIASDAVIATTTGTAQPSDVMEKLGGIGPELQPQIGLGMNILTLAGKKVYNVIKQKSTGIGEGVVVLDLPINPWSSMVLNQYAYEWAKLHQVFYGALNIHITLVSAATIMGTLTFAFVPRMYSKDSVVEQPNLDAFNPIEMVANVSGEGTIRCCPTGDEYARTCVYRESTLGDFGRLLGITATNLYNSFAAEMDVQIKVACFFSTLVHSVNEIN